MVAAGQCNREISTVAAYTRRTRMHDAQFLWYLYDPLAIMITEQGRTECDIMRGKLMPQHQHQAVFTYS